MSKPITYIIHKQYTLHGKQIDTVIGENVRNNE